MHINLFTSCWHSLPRYPSTTTTMSTLVADTNPSQPFKIYNLPHVNTEFSSVEFIWQRKGLINSELVIRSRMRLHISALSLLSKRVWTKYQSSNSELYLSSSALTLRVNSSSSFSFYGITLLLMDTIKNSMSEAHSTSLLTWKVDYIKNQLAR